MKKNFLKLYANLDLEHEQCRNIAFGIALQYL